MKKIILLFFIFLLSSTCSKKPSNFSIPVVSYENTASGGIVVERNTILVNWHLVKNRARFVSLRNCRGDIRLGNIIKRDKDSDLALIKIIYPNQILLSESGISSTNTFLHKSIQMRLEPIHTGDNLRFLGHSLEKEKKFWVSRVGVVVRSYANSNLITIDNYGKKGVYKKPVILSTIPANYGSSGGGVFDTEGKLVGMVFAMTRNNNAVIIPTSVIINFLEE